MVNKGRIIIKRKYYNYYEDYDTYEKALKQAKIQHRRNKKCKYFIIKVETGFIVPKEKYRLYLTRVIKLI